MSNNLILLTDSYKVSHHRQYPKGTETIYSYFESRGGKFPQTVFFGLQYFLKKYLSGQVVSHMDILEAEEYFGKHFGSSGFMNKEGWQHIVDKHNGVLPISIKAVAEGTLVPTSNALMTIENTDPECYWLTNYLETLLVQVWYPTTVATISYYMKRLINEYLEKTGDPSLVNFKLHDFGFRGVSSPESAMIGGMAHLVNFMGTDTMAAIIGARRYYDCDMAGFSIPASEHSTMCSWGADKEAEAMENMLDQYPDGLVACVSDSYDIYNACENIWGGKLKHKILGRDGTLVVRPDSGHPPEVVCNVLNILGNKFGCSINSKGYRVLDPHIRVIQGDGCDLEMCRSILAAMELTKWSSDNIAFGMGGGLLQKLNRDTQKFAFKCSAIKKNGLWGNVYKNPVTDTGKRSKPGKLCLELVDGAHGKVYRTTEVQHFTGKDLLTEVFRDGILLKSYTLDEIREHTKMDTQYWQK